MRVLEGVTSMIAAALFATAAPFIAYGATVKQYACEDMKPVLAYVQARRRPGDAMYVHYGAAPAVAFYATRYGLRESDYAVGGCHRGDNRQYLHEFDTLRERPRVWIVITHVLRSYGASCASRPPVHRCRQLLLLRLVGWLECLSASRKLMHSPPAPLAHRRR
jgi:hypothetical protein